MSYILGAAEAPSFSEEDSDFVSGGGSPMTMPSAGADGAPAGMQIDPALVKEFGPLAATLGQSLAQFLSSIGVAIRYVAVSEEQKRRQQAAAAAEAARRTDWSRFALPALILGVGGVVGFQVFKKRRARTA